jgi:hypothetical protein
MKKKTVFRWKWIDGRKQEPPDYDFHITPCLTFSTVKIENLGTAWGFGIELGYWAIGFGFYTVILKRC